MHQIRITIKNGQVQVKAEGFEGPSCATITAPFIDALGQRLAETPTAEFYQQPAQLEQEARQ